MVLTSAKGTAEADLDPELERTLRQRKKEPERKMGCERIDVLEDGATEEFDPEKDLAELERLLSFDSIDRNSAVIDSTKSIRSDEVTETEFSTEINPEAGLTIVTKESGPQCCSVKGAEFEEIKAHERNNKHEAEWFDLCEFDKFNFRETEGFDSCEVTKFDLNNLGSNEVDKVDLCVFEKFNLCEDELSEAISSLCESESFELCEDKNGETEINYFGEGVTETEKSEGVTDVCEVNIEECTTKFDLTNRDEEKKEQGLSWEINDSDAEWKGKLDAMIENVFASFEYNESQTMKQIKNQNSTVQAYQKSELHYCTIKRVELKVIVERSGEQRITDIGDGHEVLNNDLPREKRSVAESKTKKKVKKVTTEKNLKELPEYWKYAFFDNNNTQPGISSQLEPDREAESLEVFTDYEEARDRRFFKYFPPDQEQVYCSFLQII